MKKVNFIQSPIRNPEYVPVYGTGYHHDISHDDMIASDLKNVLLSISNDCLIRYYDKSFFIKNEDNRNIKTKEYQII